MTTAAQVLRRWSRSPDTLLVGLPLLLLLVMAFSHRWVAEDAYINFRVVDHLLAGHGPVFNHGQRVEVATSVVWLYLLVPGRLLPGMGVEVWSVLLGLAGTTAGLALGAGAARRLWSAAVPGSGTVQLPVGLVVLAALPAMWDWSTSGLETGLTTAWLGSCAWVLAGLATGSARRAGHDSWWGPVVLGLGPLVRPDLAVVSALWLLVAMWLCRRAGARPVWFALRAAALPVAYEVFRAGYYGTLVPNPVLTKDATGVYWDAGWNYLADFTVPYLLWVPLLAAAVAAATAARRRRLPSESAVVLGALGGAGLLYGLLVVRGGGDYMHARLLVPALVATSLPVLRVPVPARLRRRPADLLSAAAVAVVLAWAVVCAVSLRPTLSESGTSTSYNLEEERLLAIAGGQLQHPVRLEDLQSDRRWAGEAIAAHHRRHPGDLLLITSFVITSPESVEFADLPPGIGRAGRTVVIDQAMGVLPYASDLEVWYSDSLGITDPLAARGEAWTLTPGHRKLQTAETQLSRSTEPGAEIPVRVIPHDPARLAAARELLGCGAVAELIDAVEAPLTPGRFLRNLVGAPARTFLQIPREPIEARDQLC